MVSHGGVGAPGDEGEGKVKVTRKLDKFLLANGTEMVLSKEFIEWFRGFTDAEGCFMLSRNSKSSFKFTFTIGLHKDDIAVLKFIQDTLGGIGKINEYSTKAFYIIAAKKDINVIQDIFSNYPLNSSKHLNFSDFHRAFNIYTTFDDKGEDSLSTSDKGPATREELFELIETIAGGINNKRTNYIMPKDHLINITPY